MRAKSVVLSDCEMGTENFQLMQTAHPCSLFGVSSVRHTVLQFSAML